MPPRPQVPGSETEEEDILYNLQNGYNGGNTIYNNAPIRYCAMRGFQSCVQYLLSDPAVGGIKDALKLALKYEEDPTPIVELIMSDRYQRLSYDHMQDIISRHGAEFRNELLTRLFVIQHEAEEAAQAEAYEAAVEAAPATLPPEPEESELEWGGAESPYSLELAQRQYESARSRSRSRSRSRGPRSQTAVAPPDSDYFTNNM